MLAGDILSKVKGLTRDRLTYFVRVGYIKPKKVKRGTLFYNEFSKKDFLITQRAWEYITKYQMRVRASFERAKKEIRKELKHEKR